MMLDQLGVPRLRDYWVWLALRGVHYAGRSRQLDYAYLIEDPWHLGSPQEQARFGWTNQLIADHIVPHDTILEIGCGEGHQSQYLARQCSRLYGIDVSSRAVRRARLRCPDGSFAVGDPGNFRFGDAPPVVDLVVACEMLYYVKDIPRFIARISELGRSCLVTYYSEQAPSLDPYLTDLRDAERTQFSFGAVTWIAVWWRNRSAARK
jgi:2-polyprenyl-3-methyl-5-hydroxy-6-metoxy-1,4-benzoquinol methylase